MADESNCPKVMWIKSLASVGLKPELVILESAKPADIDACETKWISMALSLGWQLTNKQKVLKLERKRDGEDEINNSLKIHAAQSDKIVSDNQYYDLVMNYRPKDVYEAIKANLYKPIYVDDCIVYLVSDPTHPMPQDGIANEGRQYAAMYITCVVNGKVRYFVWPSFRVPYSMLPGYAIASLDKPRLLNGLSSEHLYNREECAALDYEYTGMSPVDESKLEMRLSNLRYDVDEPTC